MVNVEYLRCLNRFWGSYLKFNSTLMRMSMLYRLSQGRVTTSFSLINKDWYFLVQPFMIKWDENRVFICKSFKNLVSSKVDPLKSNYLWRWEKQSQKSRLGLIHLLSWQVIVKYYYKVLEIASFGGVRTCRGMGSTTTLNLQGWSRYSVGAIFKFWI